MRESVVETQVVKHAEATGWITRKMAYVGRRGCRDRDFYGFGQTVKVEFKKPDGNLSALQARERKRLAAVGVIVHIVDNIEQGKALLDARRRETTWVC